MAINVAQWLKELGLAQYSASFAANDIDAEVLADLTAEDLIGLGVTSVGHRRRLLNAISRLRDAGRTPALPQVGKTSSDGAERRQLTVMFCDLVGSTALASRFDPEDLRNVLASYRRAVTEAVDRVGGFVAKYMGDGVLAYFGYPEAHENDAKRAVRAGLAVIDAIRLLHTPEALHVRLGIASGLVVVGDLIGQGEAQERGVVGGTPNLAARLQALAPPDAIIISDSTRRQIGTLFDAEDIGPQLLSGFAEPQRAWRVLGESGVLNRFEALRSAEMPLIGREEELELLLRRWQQAKNGRGRIVLISGEPGIGKSRLTTAAMESLAKDAHTRLRYFCSPYHQDTALYPFIAQLERAAEFAPHDTVEEKHAKLANLLTKGSKTPQQLALIAELLSLQADSVPDVTPQRKREMLLETMVAQLEAEAQSRPVLMIFEDAHWIDPTSRELLDLVVARVEHLPLLLVVTFRPEFQPTWSDRPNVTLVTLNRLGDREVAALVEYLAGSMQLRGQTVSEIVERADGVPLFIEELTKAVLEGSDRDDLVAAVLSASPLRGLPVPATLHASLIARLDRLGARVKEVAQVGAVLGREFSYELIQIIAGRAEAELQDVLERLIGAGLLFCRGTPPYSTYLFKHALVQDAAYSTLLRTRRQELHSRVADAFEVHFSDIAERQPELVARHLTGASLPERAADYWLRAGKISLAKSAVREAIAQLHQGLALLSDISDQHQRARRELDIVVTLAPALMSAKGYADPEVTSTLARARQLIAETENTGTDLHFFVLYGLCAAYYVAGDPKAMIEEATAFLALAQSHATAGPVLVGHRLLGSGMMMMGDYRNAGGHLEQACRLYEPKEHRSLGVRYGQDIGVSAFVYLSWALWHQGYPDQSKTVIKSAVEHARDCDHAHTLTYALLHAAITSMLLREVAAAGAYAVECVSLATEHVYPLWKGLGQILFGWATGQQGDASAAAIRIREGLATAERTGSRWLEPWFLGLLAEALGSVGQVHEATRVLEDALERAAASGQHCADAELNRILGELDPRVQNLKQREMHLQRAIDVARQQGSRGFELRAATSLARLWSEHGQQARVRQILAPIYDGFTEGFATADLMEAKSLLDNFAEAR